MSPSEATEGALEAKGGGGKKVQYAFFNSMKELILFTHMIEST